MEYSEKDFEDTIAQTLLASDWNQRPSNCFDSTLCLAPGDVIDFVYATQPGEWDKYKKTCGANAKEYFLKRLSSEISRRGTLDVLRKGVKTNGARFQLAYFEPVSSLNVELQKRYRGNIFSFVRQLHYSAKSNASIDIVLFLNGLPIISAELKNPLNGQNVLDGMRQYRISRNSKEPLFDLGHCLAHFAVDPNLVYVTSRLEGQKTSFIPFNQGHNNGAGNPPSWKGFSTAYLWEQIWSKSSILNLIQHFIQMVDKTDDRNRKVRTLVFPRYHQLIAVRRLVVDCSERGPGQRYLIHHSAGSGKSNTIAWLAHQLYLLHDKSDRPIFDSVVIITDRLILDRQLQQTVSQFQQFEGIVENIEKTSRQLKQALETGKKIIVSTLQKFPVIAEEASNLPGERFAVIIDEAHSSQTGERRKSLQQVLATSSLEEAERMDYEPEDDLQERILAEIKKRKAAPHISYFAFTATPKPATLEFFGIKCPDGSYEPFSTYPMRQAIEEGFILDVLENYTTYKTYWQLLKTIEQDPHYMRDKAASLIQSFVDLHEHAISRKVDIIMEHFTGQVMHRISGKAKAMLVTRSRLHAVRYKLAIDKYLQEKGQRFKALVAFSGTVSDEGSYFTEAGMNGFSQEQTAGAFDRDEYKVLVVANKFQYGFDQPLLHTMYVDKRLGGVNAVQTLSRLDRVCPGKEDTMVLDFANEADEIQKSFEPYYDTVILTEGTDPNLLYDMETRLEGFSLYTQEDVDKFVSYLFDAKATQDKLYAVLRQVVDRFKSLTPEKQKEFHRALRDYAGLYSFLSQILPFADPDLEKLYRFAYFLVRILPSPRDRLPIEIKDQIDLDSYRIQAVSSGKIKITGGEGELKPIKKVENLAIVPNHEEPLSRIIQELNKRFGTDFSEEDKVFIAELESKLQDNEALQKSVRINPPEDARLTFDHVAVDMIQNMIDTNFKFYKQITDNAEFGKLFLDWLFERYRHRLRIS
jgi:type I restriction enzyme R subunit